jgi:hypothetical protein
MQVKAIPMEFKVDHSKRIVEGYASTFGNKDRVGDIVQPGAFTKTISERFNGGAKKDIKVLWQHAHPIGLPIHMEEDSKGLYTVSRIAKTPQGDEAMTLAEEGIIDKFSIGYDIIKSDYQGKDQLLQELKLYEYSLVTFPANEEAGLTSVKSAGVGLGMPLTELNALIREFHGEDLTTLLKEGRALSSGNRQKVSNAIDALQSSISALQELLDLAEGSKGVKPPVKELDSDMLQSILKNLKI